MGKIYRTRAQAARGLGLSRQAVAQAVKRGQIECTSDGIDVDELEEWRKARIKAAADELARRQSFPTFYKGPEFKGFTGL